jgi:hypothetical protein
MTNSNSLDNLLILGLDRAGQRKTMSLTDALRLAISGYKLGYQDGVGDSKDILNDQQASENKESTNQETEEKTHEGTLPA